jgi:microcystin-dependent protein
MNITNKTNLMQTQSDGGGGNYDIVKKVLNWLESNSNSVAVGTVIAVAGKTIPDGYLLCNGAAVSRSAYANLFQAIGTTYGRGDGSTTFNVPDLNYRFVEGTVTANNVGTKKNAGLPNITGKVMLGNYPLLTSEHEGAFFGSDYGVADKHGQDSINNVPTTFSIDASRSSAVYGKSSTVQPASLCLLHCIKY